jgi:proline dehydrogenase
MADIDTLYRRIVLATADAGFVKRFVERNGWRLGVGRFIAGPDVTSAVPRFKELQAAGKRLILDALGEFVTSEAEARRSADGILAAVDVVAAAGVEPYFSVKPTQLGLGVDRGLAHELSASVAARIATVGGHLCLDMESSPYVDATLDLLVRLRAEGHLHVSGVLQSYLHRTADDLERLLALSPAPALRIVKGAYKEPVSVALQNKADVDAGFVTLVERCLAAGAHVNIGTHDERLITGLLTRIDGATGVSYEIQMLFGVRPALQDRLVAAGRPLRVYTPFGSDWYGYYSRRLAERPANLGVVVRGMFG